MPRTTAPAPAAPGRPPPRNGNPRPSPQRSLAATRRAYCRPCDAAVAAAGNWPGRCGQCRGAIEPHPVPDIVAPGLRVLFVGINPGIQTARARRHFANPANLFWRALHDGGLTPTRLAPGDEAALLALGFGITNAVTRATPGSADVTREDIVRGREHLQSLAETSGPEWLAFVGKQAFTMATGARRAAHGVQPGRLWGARVFVLPSTSPANAAVPPQEKVRWFREIAGLIG